MWLRLEAVIINSMCTCQIYVYEKSLDQRIVSLQEQKLTMPAATQHQPGLCSLNYCKTSSSYSQSLRPQEKFLTVIHLSSPSLQGCQC